MVMVVRRCRIMMVMADCVATSSRRVAVVVVRLELHVVIVVVRRTAIHRAVV